MDYQKEIDQALEKEEWSGGERRGLARVEDLFLVYFSVMDEEWYKNNKELFVSRKTSERDNLFFVDPALGKYSRNRSQTSDPVLFHMMLEINRKLDALIKALPDKQEADILRQHEALCRDISGEGIKFRCDIPLMQRDILNLLIPLPSTHPALVSAIGLVKRSSTIVDEFTEEKTHEHGLEFLAINEEDREEIIAYSFKRQREIISLSKSRDASKKR